MVNAGHRLVGRQKHSLLSISCTKMAKNKPVVPPPSVSDMKQKKNKTVAVEPAFFSITDFLTSSNKLGTALPASPEALAGEDASSSDSDSDVSLDERVLMLQRFNDGDDAVDWIGEFAGTSEDDDDNDDERVAGDTPEADSAAEAEVAVVKKSRGKKPSRAVRLPVDVAPPNPTPVPQKQLLATISGRPIVTHSHREQPDIIGAAPLVRSTALTASRAVEASATSGMRADALAGIPVFKKEPTSAPSKQAAPVAPLEKNRADIEIIARQRALKPARSAVAAFSPVDPKLCLYVGNLPHDAALGSDDAIKAALQQFGKVRSVHVEVNNNGKPAGFGYVEFKTTSSVDAAVKSVKSSAASVELAGRPLRLQAYTSDLNYRNPDGSRKREKVKAPVPIKTAAGRGGIHKGQRTPFSGSKRRRDPDDKD